MTANNDNNLTNLFADFKEKLLEGLFVGSVGVVTKYVKGLASVKPLVNSKGENELPIQEPLLHRVPLISPGSPANYVKVPAMPGQFVLIIFLDKSIDELIRAGSPMPVITEETGEHLMSNAIGLLLGHGFFDYLITDDIRPLSTDLVGPKVYIGSPQVDLVAQVHNLTKDVQTLIGLLSGDVDTAGTASTGKLSMIASNLALLSDGAAGSIDQILTNLALIKND
jgi:hypothetical protein